MEEEDIKPIPQAIFINENFRENPDAHTGSESNNGRMSPQDGRIFDEDYIVYSKRIKLDDSSDAGHIDSSCHILQTASDENVVKIERDDDDDKDSSESGGQKDGDCLQYVEDCEIKSETETDEAALQSVGECDIKSELGTGEDALQSVGDWEIESEMGTNEDAPQSVGECGIRSETDEAALLKYYLSTTSAHETHSNTGESSVSQSSISSPTTTDVTRENRRAARNAIRERLEAAAWAARKKQPEGSQNSCANNKSRKIRMGHPSPLKEILVIPPLQLSNQPMTNAQRSKRAYDKKKECPEEYKKYLVNKAISSKGYREKLKQTLTEEEKEEHRRRVRERVKKHRMNQKKQPKPDREVKKSKPLTYHEKEKLEEKKQKDRERKKLERAGWSQQKKKEASLKAKERREKRNKLDQYDDKDTYDALRRHFHSNGKGRPPDLPKGLVVSNRLLLQLYFLKEEHNYTYNVVKTWLDKLAPITSTVPPERIRTRIEFLLNNIDKCLLSLGEEFDFHALAEPLQKLGITRLHLMGHCDFNGTLLENIPNGVVLALSKFRSQNQKTRTFVIKWLNILCSWCCQFTAPQLNARIDSVVKIYKRLGKRHSTKSLQLKEFNDSLFLRPVIKEISPSQSKTDNDKSTQCLPVLNCSLIKGLEQENESLTLQLNTQLELNDSLNYSNSQLELRMKDTNDKLQLQTQIEFKNDALRSMKLVEEERNQLRSLNRELENSIEDLKETETYKKNTRLKCENQELKITVDFFEKQVKDATVLKRKLLNEQASKSKWESKCRKLNDSLITHSDNIDFDSTEDEDE